MNYHNIKTCDMLNGEGLRVVLFVSGCGHHCKGCHNPETWNPDSGILFDEAAKRELFDELDRNYITGLTISGGDPLFESNLDTILHLLTEFHKKYQNREKDVWLYTGYEYSQIMDEQDSSNESMVMKKRRRILSMIDVLVDGRFDKEKSCVEYPYAGSTNQNIIRLQNKKYRL